MKKRTAIWLVVIASIGVLCFGLGYWLHGLQDVPRVEVVDSTNMLEIYQEYEPSQIREIRIKGVNVNVRISRSDNRNIRIVYQPPTDTKTFQYVLHDGILYLTVEQIEAGTSFIPQDAEIVSVYLPQNSQVAFVNETESGYLDMQDVSLTSLQASSLTGMVSLNGVTVAEQAELETVSGKILMKNSSFLLLEARSNMGDISCAATDIRTCYAIWADSSSGTISVNGEAVNAIRDSMDETEIRSMRFETGSGSIRLRFEEDDGNEPTS